MQIIDSHNSYRLAGSTLSSSTGAVSNDQHNTSVPVTKKPKRFLTSLMDEITPVVISRPKDEIDVYIELKLKDDEIYENPFIFWYQCQSMFHHLSKLARKIFAVPCSCVAVEREFSAAGQIATQRRSNLEPTTIHDIIFLRSIENNKRII